MEVVQAKDFKAVLEIWAQNIVTSYKQLKSN